MRRSKDGSHTKRGGKALGVIGVSLSLAGVACAESNPVQASTAPPTANARTSLHEVEMLDVTLGSFRIFDREDAQDAKPQAVAWGCRGCRGCFGCRGCRGCRGCAG
jgi:hypothetical protein